MIKPTLVILSDNSTVILEPTVVCELSSVLCYEDQYFTWVLVVAGWLVAIFIALWQKNKGAEATKQACSNEWIREFREKMDNLEDYSYLFWTSEASVSDQGLFFTKTARNIKELTRIAKELETVSGTEYPSRLFMELRQSITGDANINSMPLSTSSAQLIKIRTTCKSLREVYKRTTK